MVPPSFNGVFMFGIAVVMKPAQMEPVEHQQTDYPGLDGLEDMKLGERGAYTEVTGMLYAAFQSDLNAAIGTFRAATRWGKCVLTDNFGNAWPFVRLVTFRETGRVTQDPLLGYCRTYEAKFFHAFLP